MSLSHLSLNNFRNIEALTLEPVNGINIIYGENGSGKTSLLEAIYFLSHGKSFRTAKHKNIIQHQQDKIVIYINFWTQNSGDFQNMQLSFL